jgi:DsbC/DsbD-like thiol-disulfide interchange protein
MVRYALHVGALALLGGVIAALTASASFSAPAPSAGTVKAKLMASVSAVQPGKPFDAGVLFAMEKGWHVYWKNPGDAGLATSVEWKLPEGFTAGPLRWPAPETFQQPGNIVGYGYEGSALLVATVTPPKDLVTGKDVDIGADVSWLGCEQLCVPGSQALTMALPVAPSAEPANKQLFDEWAAKTPRPAPDFTAKDQDGNTVSLSDYKGRVLVLEWFNPDCPFVQRHHAQRTTMIDLAAKYAPRGVAWLAVNSTYYMPPKTTAEWREKWKMAYPVLIDRDGKIAHAYDAKATPDMFVIDGQGAIVYEGAIDNDAAGRLKESVNYVDKALTELLADKPIGEPKTKPYGCSVKYPPEGQAGQ